MATRKPLVLVDGAMSELPSGDTVGGLPVATAPGQPLVFEQLGGGAPIESVTLALGRQSMSHEQVLTRSGTLPSQSVRAWLVDSGDNDVWQLEGVNINAVAGTGEITFYLSCQYFESGNINANFEVK
jgi:hypothetical protein